MNTQSNARTYAIITWCLRSAGKPKIMEMDCRAPVMSSFGKLGAYMVILDLRLLANTVPAMEMPRTPPKSWKKVITDVA